MRWETKLALIVVGLSIVFGLSGKARSETALCNGKPIPARCGCLRDGLQYGLDGSRGFMCLARPVSGWGKLVVVTTHWKGEYEGWFNVLGVKLKKTGSSVEVAIDKHDEHPWSVGSTTANKFVPSLTRFTGKGRSIAVIPPDSDLHHVEHRIWNERGTGCVNVSVHEVDLFEVAFKSVAFASLDVLARFLMDGLSPAGGSAGNARKGGSQAVDVIGSAVSTIAIGAAMGTSKEAIAAEAVAKLALDEALSGLPREERIVLSSVIASFVGTLVNEIFRKADRDLSRDAVAGGERATECRSGFRHKFETTRSGG